MTWYPDLSEYDYMSEYSYLFESAAADQVILTVGWLDSQHEFPTWDPPQEFIEKLTQLCAIKYAGTRGWHDCTLPHPDGDVVSPIIIKVDGNDVYLGSAEVRVLTEDGTILAAPNLVWHYVTAHQYRPPESFIEAVRERRLAPPEPEISF